MQTRLIGASRSALVRCRGGPIDACICLLCRAARRRPVPTSRPSSAAANEVAAPKAEKAPHCFFKDSETKDWAAQGRRGRRRSSPAAPSAPTRATRPCCSSPRSTAGWRWSGPRSPPTTPASRPKAIGGTSTAASPPQGSTRSRSAAARNWLHRSPARCRALTGASACNAGRAAPSRAMADDRPPAREEARPWTRIDEYVVGLARRRTARRAQALRPRTQPEEPALLAQHLALPAADGGVDGDRARWCSSPPGRAAGTGPRAGR